MNKTNIVVMVLLALALLVWAFNALANESDSTGEYCEVNATACAVDRTVSAPNELPTPEQIDWDNHPMYEHGGQPPKNAK